MRVVYLAAGAAGMYCGSCLRDNRLVATLRAQGRDIVLIPLYTPIRTDEQDVSRPEVYYGGINVYLEQMSPIFRHTPGWIHDLLDSPRLLSAMGRFSGSTRAETLGALAVSVLKGEHGAQGVELERLIEGLRAIKPDLVNLATLMFIGMAGPIRRALGVPVLCTLSGEDVFVDGMIEPYRAQAFAAIRERSHDVDGYIAVTRYYAEHATRHFSLPAERVQYVPLGINVADFSAPPSPLSLSGGEGRVRGTPFTIGYLARIAPEKGLLNLAEAFVSLRKAGRDCRLRAAGYLGPADRPYLEKVRTYLREHDAADAFEYVGEVGRAEKLAFLHSLDVFSVPAAFHEAKGIYVLEALASGVPVVQPRRGSFPELIEATGGGLLYDSDDPAALAATIAQLMDSPAQLAELSERGRRGVRERFTDEIMAEQTWKVYEGFSRRR